MHTPNHLLTVDPGVEHPQHLNSQLVTVTEFISNFLIIGLERQVFPQQLI